MREYYVYILASKKNGTLYIGVTNDLIRRVNEHKTGRTLGFTKKHHVDKLVYYEDCNDIAEAILREKQMKKWRRIWKVKLINEANPLWRDLSEDFLRLEWIPACAGMTKSKLYRIKPRAKILCEKSGRLGLFISKYRPAFNT